MTASGNHQPLWVQALLDKSLSAVEFRLLMLLRWHQGRNGSSWPSQETIAAELGLTIEGIRQIIKRLHRAGWLTIDWPNGPGRGLNHRKRYIVTVPKTPMTVGVLQQKSPMAVGVLDTENPNGHTAKTPTAVGKHKGRTQSRTQSCKSARTKRTAGAPFTPPTVAEVREYAASRGYPDFDAEKFVAYYAAADWHDAKGNPVRNWKQKFLSVWEKNAQTREAGGREPQRGDPDWYPDEDEVDQVMGWGKHAEATP